jgi:hypothetical protein
MTFSSGLRTTTDEAGGAFALCMTRFDMACIDMGCCCPVWRIMTARPADTVGLDALGDPFITMPAPTGTAASRFGTFTDPAATPIT